MFSKRALLGTAAAIAVATGGPSVSWGQDAEDTTVLDPIVVTKEAPEDAGTAPVGGYVAAQTTAGSKTDTPVEEIPQSVTVIGREEMDDRAVQKVDEALRYVAGVTAQPFGPDSDTNWMFIRGFQATASGAYLDGLQTYSYGFGGFFTDSFTLERVEVLKGAASVLYGGSNAGGLVNYVSKRPTGERLRYLELGINDAGTAYTGLDIGDRVNDEYAYRITGRVAGGDGYSDFTDDGFRGTLSPSIEWTPNDDTSVTFLSNFTFIDEKHNGGGFLPYIGTVVDAPFGRIDPDANYNEPDIDTYLRRQYHLGYELEHRLEDVTLRQNFRYGYSKLHEVSVYPYGYNSFSLTPTAPDYLLSRINFEHETEVHSVTVDNQAEKKIDTGPVEHTLLGGVDYKFFNMDQVQKSGSATTISASNPVYGAAQGARSAYLDQNIKMHQVGLYAQDQLRFGGGWVTTLNGRYDYVSIDTDANPAVTGSGNRSYSRTDGEWSGRAGLAYAFASGLTPYTSVSTFFNPVLGASAETPVFEPETGQQYEVGLKYAPDGFDGLFTVALFDLTRQNVTTGPSGSEIQIGEVNSTGIELEARVDLTENLKATAAFSALDLEITKDKDASIIGNSPYIIPDRQASASLDYTLNEGTDGLFGGVLDGVVVGGGVRYTGSSWADNENTAKVPSATVYDARLGYGRDDWGLYLSATNLLDKTYVASCQTQYSCSYAEGRRILLKFHMNM